MKFNNHIRKEQTGPGIGNMSLRACVGRFSNFAAARRPNWAQFICIADVLARGGRCAAPVASWTATVIDTNTFHFHIVFYSTVHGSIPIAHPTRNNAKRERRQCGGSPRVPCNPRPSLRHGGRPSRFYLPVFPRTTDYGKGKRDAGSRTPTDIGSFASEWLDVRCPSTPNHPLDATRREAFVYIEWCWRHVQAAMPFHPMPRQTKPSQAELNWTEPSTQAGLALESAGHSVRNVRRKSQTPSISKINERKIILQCISSSYHYFLLHGRI